MHACWKSCSKHFIYTASLVLESSHTAGEDLPQQEIKPGASLHQQLEMAERGKDQESTCLYFLALNMLTKPCWFFIRSISYRNHVGD